MVIGTKELGDGARRTAIRLTNFQQKRSKTFLPFPTMRAHGQGRDYGKVNAAGQQDAQRPVGTIRMRTESASSSPSSSAASEALGFSFTSFIAQPPVTFDLDLSLFQC